MKYPFYIRMTILLCIGGFAPILIHHIIMKLWDVSILRAAEYTFITCCLLDFIVCIPVAFWMKKAETERKKINNDTLARR